MDDYSNRRQHNRSLPRIPRQFATASITTDAGGDSDTEADLFPDGEGDPLIWGTLNHNFRQVQTVLDRNRHLIQQVNENHQSRIPDNMVKNVSLIQEINGNISKVVSMYSDLSNNFSTAYHEHSKQSQGKRQNSRD